MFIGKVDEHGPEALEFLGVLCFRVNPLETTNEFREIIASTWEEGGWTDGANPECFRCLLRLLWMRLGFHLVFVTTCFTCQVA
jgi:hypothetical protein